MAILQWGKRREAVKRAEALLGECCEMLGMAAKELGKSGRDWIARRRWEDDVAEMRRLVYYAALTAPGAVVEAAHFPPRHRSDHEAFAKGQFDSLSLEEIVRHKVSHFFDRLGNVEAREVHRAVISQVERALIEQCLKWADGNQLKTARVLGINRNTLRKRMKELGIKI